jgi:hypothetical protein
MEVEPCDWHSLGGGGIAGTAPHARPAGIQLIPISMLVLQIYIVKDYFLKQPRRRSTWDAGTTSE